MLQLLLCLLQRSVVPFSRQSVGTDVGEKSIHHTVKVLQLKAYGNHIAKTVPDLILLEVA